LGHSRGGLSTKIHAAEPTRACLAGGQPPDLDGADVLLFGHEELILIADKGATPCSASSPQRCDSAKQLSFLPFETVASSAVLIGHYTDCVIASKPSFRE